MTLTVDDTGSITKLTISNGSKILLRKKGDMKKLLKFVLDGTNRENVKQSILGLQKVYPFMINSLTKIEIQGD